MKFKDIPQFTSAGNYEIDVPIGFIKSQIKEYKETYGLEMNPDFQRGNVWTREQQIAFLEYFFKGGKSALVIYFNHPDFGKGMAKDSDLKHMVLVDGLQRLTSLIGFIDNEIPIFGDNYFKDFEDRPRDTSYRLKFNVNDLQYRKEVLKWYIDMNNGGTVHSSQEINRVQKMLDEELNKSSKSKEKEDYTY